MALESIVKSFRRDYCDGGQTVEFASDNQSCKVKVIRPSSRRSTVGNLDVRFDPAALKITARFVDEAQSLPDITLDIEADDDGRVCMLHKGKRLTPDEASELLLDRLLFPRPQK